MSEHHDSATSTDQPLTSAADFHRWEHDHLTRQLQWAHQRADRAEQIAAATARAIGAMHYLLLSPECPYTPQQRLDRLTDVLHTLEHHLDHPDATADTHADSTADTEGDSRVATEGATEGDSAAISPDTNRATLGPDRVMHGRGSGSTAHGQPDGRAEDAMHYPGFRVARLTSAGEAR